MDIYLSDMSTFLGPGNLRCGWQTEKITVFGLLVVQLPLRWRPSYDRTVKLLAQLVIVVAQHSKSCSAAAESMK